MKSIKEIKIYEFIREQKICSLEDLQKRFSITQPTLYRYINNMAKAGAIEKIRGGIKYSSREIPDQHYFLLRMEAAKKEKEIIAEKAAHIISEHDIIFLDSSTTVYYLAAKLQQSSYSELTIITNSLLIMDEFRLFPQHYTLISTGGAYNSQLNALLGKTAEKFISGTIIHKAFISAASVSQTGYFTNYEQHASFLQTIINTAAENFMCLDSTKFNRTALIKIADYNNKTVLLSDKNL